MSGPEWARHAHTDFPLLGQRRVLPWPSLIALPPPSSALRLEPLPPGPADCNATASNVLNKTILLETFVESGLGNFDSAMSHITWFVKRSVCNSVA